MDLIAGVWCVWLFCMVLSAGAVACCGVVGFVLSVLVYVLVGRLCLRFWVCGGCDFWCFRLWLLIVFLGGWGCDGFLWWRLFSSFDCLLLV